MNPEIYMLRSDIEKGTHNILTYQNLYPASLGFAASEKLLDWRSNSNPFKMQDNFLSLASGYDGFEFMKYFDAYTVDRTEVSNLVEPSYTSATGYNSFSKINGGSMAYENIFLTAKKTQSVYVYMETSEVNSIVISTPYQTSRGVNPDTNEQFVVDCGLVNEGEEIKIYVPFDPDSSNSGSFSLYVVGFDLEAFQADYENLMKGAWNITKSNDTSIEGTVNAAQSGILYTSIPYDKGWKAFVDGKEVEINPKPDWQKKLEAGSELYSRGLIHNTLCFIELSQGPHTVEFKFVPKGFAMGAAITVLAVSVCLLLAVLWFIRQKNAKILAAKIQAEELSKESPEELYEETSTVGIENGIMPEEEKLDAVSKQVLSDFED
jgi:uncharacterized membrane protein YfhO